MKLSEAIRLLEAVKEKHGDLPIVGGQMSDDSCFRRVVVLDKNDINAEHSNLTPVGAFLE